MSRLTALVLAATMLVAAPNKGASQSFWQLSHYGSGIYGLFATNDAGYVVAYADPDNLLISNYNLPDPPLCQYE